MDAWSRVLHLFATPRQASLGPPRYALVTADLHPCPGCGTRYPAFDGPVHRYIGASAACWAVYGALLVGAEPDQQLLDGSVAAPSAKRPTTAGPPSTGALLVDAYAAQHQGDTSAQAVQSVAVHLLALHAVVRRGEDAGQALWVRRRAVRQRGVFTPLEPPALGAALSIRHLFPGTGVGTPCTPGEYVMWVFLSWEALYASTIERWYAAYV